jgi:hypothetical protein
MISRMPPHARCITDEPHLPENQSLDLAAIQDRWGTARGQRYWRSFEELAETDAFREFLQREFPEQATE